jgi:phosphatidylglycerophosphate synthase
MLDEMDGKQARKTGNSSPLGLLFDHGCDSFTTALLTIIANETGGFKTVTVAVNANYPFAEALTVDR